MLPFFLKTAVFFILFSFPVKQGRSGPCFEKLNWSGLTIKQEKNVSCTTVLTIAQTEKLKNTNLFKHEQPVACSPGYPH